MLGQKLGQILEKPCVSSRGHFFNPSLKIGHVGLKNRSLGQILEKPCVCCRGHIVSPVHMKLGQDVCLDESSDEFESRLCQVEN